MKKLHFILLSVLIISANTIGGKILHIHDFNNVQVLEINKVDEKDLNSIYSSKKLGSFIENSKTIFRIFAPNAVKLKLIVFDNVEDSIGVEYLMTKDEDGVWESVIEQNLNYKYYGYKIYKEGEELEQYKPLLVDPYAKAVATYNTYMNPRKSIVYEDKYDWEGDEWIRQDWRDLIIYEMHIKDMTAHKSAQAKKPGTYSGLIEKNIKGGLEYIKDLGVNTVELLPAQEFGCCEIPFKKPYFGRFNTWNPYERNHWGYMTSNFFAPAAYYSEDWNEFKWNTWMGKDAKQVKQFKDMVKAFHKEGIAVIMDVVYNHLSEYELGNLKEIDKEYYFRLDTNGNYIAESGCGNDLKTERPMVRRMIIESILYWMQEYHIDGFRFDLGKLIDWETIEEVIREAKKINPNVVFVCEPWGGGYDPKGFSLRGWGAWNDQIRNGIKGENPLTGLGWIFGKWYGNNNIDRIKSYVNGTLAIDKEGLFQTKEHSVNYLESHDGYTLGDFIRIGLNNKDADSVIKNVEEYSKLNETQLKLNKLGALFLFTSQGIIMIHAGQEFARSKVIPFDLKIDDNHRGIIDHNTYNKDNEVNYINYNIAEQNKELVDYYKGLIAIRKSYKSFSHADYNKIEFFTNNSNEFFLGYKVRHKKEEFLVYFNADPKKDIDIKLPKGEWEIIANEEIAGLETIKKIKNGINIPASSGCILRKAK
jgi:pullulanase/glycogen debranching enzyme